MDSVRPLVFPDKMDFEILVQALLNEQEGDFSKIWLSELKQYLELYFSFLRLVLLF
jgi:hypothetical protein